MKPVVIKVGGGTIAGGALEDLPGVLGSGREVALVHGGGPQLTGMLDALGMTTRFREGLRVTDERTLEVAEMVFAGFVPVVAPLGLGPEGAYNVNADAAAAALAVGLEAEHLFLLTDVDGLLKDGAPVGSLAPGECQEYVASGLAAGGMVPKLRAAAEAARSGVSARIINGNREGALEAALAGEEVGTLISEGVVA